MADQGRVGDKTLMQYISNSLFALFFLLHKLSVLFLLYPLLTFYLQKRVLLYGPEACALKKVKGGDGVCLMRRDRCIQACWLSARKLLFTTPIMLAEPSQTAFRFKRYGLN